MAGPAQRQGQAGSRGECASTREPSSYKHPYRGGCSRAPATTPHKVRENPGLEGRVRAHVFLCMLAYYLEWHMRQRLAPMLFDDTDPEEAEARRHSVVAQAQQSKAAVKKQTTGMTPDGLPVHSFRTLLADLAT